MTLDRRIEILARLISFGIFLLIAALAALVAWGGIKLFQLIAR